MPVTVKKRSPWAVQKSVLHALLVREFKARIGKFKFGLFWAFFQPIVTVVMLSLLFGLFMGRTSAHIPYPLFVLCGFVPFTFIMRLWSGGVGAIPANYGLLTFTQVKPLDPFIARFCMESFITVTSFFIFIGIAAYLDLPVEIHNIFFLFGILLLTFLFGSGLGLISGILTNQFPESQKVVKIIQRPLLYICCVLYPLSSIPPKYRYFFEWNPIVNSIELSRKAVFNSYKTDIANLNFLGACAIISLALGLSMYQARCHYLRQPTRS